MSKFIVLLQDLSNLNPKCEVLSISESHIQATESMLSLVGDASELIDIYHKTPNRIEIHDKNPGYIYSSKNLNRIYSIQEFINTCT